MRWRLALAAILIATPAAAAETGGCGAFKWPIAADIALLEAANWQDSGATIALDGPVGLRLKLGPLDAAGFALPPERAPATAAQNGSLRFEAKAGTYQVTLSEPAWTDLVQDGAALKPAAFSGVKDCEGARKSLRYELKAGPVTLQISNAPGRSVGVAITPPQ
ncbi:hypothetical protein ACFQI3_06145 [Hansschlegelia quercus]|uniref:Uncharacterized protein n=1 Tax=Hansschlegelia quercus TaxID=2528245 RepID=A0A4Q9GPM4_9HYPH|nr:hypothetical protein [Hansschlegelia quercus]TBN53860.1 hypothetical protein EYR15_08695 [Hansschlegelia quercus]